MKDFSDYLVSLETGFLINQKEKINVPIYYDPWIRMKNELETLMNSDLLWNRVDELPLLSIKFLLYMDQLCYCHSILAHITAAYVWYKRDIKIPKVLPKSISIPLRELSDKLGLMPILCHADMVIANTIVDTTKTIFDKNSVVIKETLMSDNNWNIFQRETARIELCFAPIIREIYHLNQSIMQNNPNDVINSLKAIGTTIYDMVDTMKYFNELDPNYFHTQMRPFFVGWAGDSFPNKDGLIYEDKNGSSVLIPCIGASAGQSPTLQVLDALFKIKHSKDSQLFLETMKLYMLKEHREFINDLEKCVDLQSFIKFNIENRYLIESYNECLSAISFFRTKHMLSVTKFIINPAKKIAKVENTFEFLQERGTGGQELLKFLKEVRDDSVKQILKLD